MIFIPFPLGLAAVLLAAETAEVGSAAAAYAAAACVGAASLAAGGSGWGYPLEETLAPAWPLHQAPSCLGEVQVSLQAFQE